MSKVDVPHVIAACERVVLDFMAHFDAGDHDAMLPLFAEDGVWSRVDGDVLGRDGLKTVLEKRSPQIRVAHVMSNFRTKVDIVQKTAEVTSYVTVYRHDDQQSHESPAPLNGPRLVGRYIDVLHQLDGSWRIISKRVEVLFSSKAESK